MFQKKVLKRVFKTCEARVQLREKQFEKAIARIAEAKAKFEEDKNCLKADLFNVRSEVFNGEEDDLFGMLRWLEEVQKKEVKLLDDLKDVRKVIYSKK